MAVNERTRHELYEAARAVMGDEAAETLMEMLPPVGWADVATKQDLEALSVATKRDLDAMEERIDLRVDAKLARLEGRFLDELRKQTNRFMASMVVVAGASLTAAELLGRMG